MIRGKEEHMIDRSKWPRGPWDEEPEDRVEFEHAGLPCLLRRSPGSGGWCGYAAVPPGHPLHGADYGDLGDIEVHGGLTYSDPCAGEICHVPKPGEPDDVWWFGFDCAHAYDRTPGMEAALAAMGGLGPDAVYRTRAYAEAETRRLAEQLAARARP